MADHESGPRPGQVNRLKALMERVGESENRIETLLTIAALDGETCADLLEVYQRKAAHVVAKDVFYPYEAIDGEFRLGTDPDGRPIGLTREQVNEHILLVGMTGSGKTTFFYNLLATCDGLEVPFMIFDFKNDYRYLVDHHDLVVINWRDLKFNPLAPPPNVQTGKWGEVLADTFAHATDLLSGSESYFLDRLRILYRLYAEDDRAPSLFELRDLVANDRVTKASPRFQYKERVGSRLEMMTGFSGDIFDCSQGYPLEELLDRNVVFELKEPNRYVTNFVVEALLTWIFYYRDAMGQRQRLRHLILFDEAKRVFDVNRGRQTAAGYPPIDDLLGKIREFGEGLVVADHEPSKLTDSLKANTLSKLWLTLGSGTDITEMGRTFGLDHDELDFTRTMAKGEGLFKLADRKPVPILLPDYRIAKTLTEADIRDRMAPILAALDTQERYRPDRFQSAIGAHRDETADEEAESTVGEVAKALLVSVNEHPFLNMSERYQTVAVDTKKGTRAKNELITLGLVREVEVNTRKRGRNPKMLELTNEGRRILRDRGHDIVSGTKGGVEHRWWQQKVKTAYEAQDYEVTVEYQLGKKSIDVYAVRADETVAIELAFSPDHEVENIKKCLAHGPDRIQVVYAEDQIKDAIQAHLREELGDIPGQVFFSPLKEFA